MKRNIFLQLSLVVLFILGLTSIVDLGFGPIVICPQCGVAINKLIAVILMILPVGAFVLDRRQAQR